MALLVAFILLTWRSYDGFFTDDELDNLSWTPRLPLSRFIAGLVTPLFARDNFRPVGHAYFAIVGRLFGIDFPPYMTPVLAFHLLNTALIYALLRRLSVGVWQALGGAAFFLLSAGAFDAWWKPMYVFDLLCATFCLLAVLLYSRGRIFLAFLAFWLAYKSKELAVMLPVVLLAYEYWFGSRRFLKLIPFFLASLSFGIQGIVLNPNKNNEYTFRFNLDALRVTIPFYAQRFLLIPFSGIVILALALIRDRRVWLGLVGMVVLLSTLLFLPGRLYIAYAYLPLAFAAVAIASALARVHPGWLWLLLVLWMPWNLREFRHLKRAKLAADDEAYNFVAPVMRWSVKHPHIETLIYDGVPTGFNHWGVTAAWNIARHRVGEHAFYRDWPQAAPALNSQTVAYAHWDDGSVIITTHSPGEPIR